MRKKTILERLIATYLMLLALPPEKFRYGVWVCGLNDRKPVCGTVACIAGWMPQYIPESGFYWGHNDSLEHPKINYEDDDTYISTIDVLAQWHGIKSELASVLFAGSSLFDFSGDDPIKLIQGVTQHASLEVVKELWKNTIEMIENNKLDKFLTLPNYEKRTHLRANG